MPAESTDAYIHQQPPDVQARLRRIQALVAAEVPDATGCIAYQMPAFRRGRVFFYYGAFKKHIGIYPPADDPDVIALSAAWRGPKGNLTFPHAGPLPEDVLLAVVRSLERQYAR